MLTARIHSFETFGSVDGPGIRFVVFFQGCQMRCMYCHNPDSWKLSAGTEYTVDQIIRQAVSYKPYWGKKGGITCSGGEPLLQIDFLIEFFRRLKELNIHTTLDTAGGPFTREEPFFSKFRELMQYTDLVMLDLKHINSACHKELTKVDNGNILDCARYLAEINKEAWIRHVLVPGYTDKDEDLQELSDFINTLPNVSRIEVLPYHSFGMFKWEEMGLPYKLKDTPAPDEATVDKARKILHVQTYSEYKRGRDIALG